MAETIRDVVVRIRLQQEESKIKPPDYSGALKSIHQVAQESATSFKTLESTIQGYLAALKSTQQVVQESVTTSKSAEAAAREYADSLKTTQQSAQDMATAIKPAGSTIQEQAEAMKTSQDSAKEMSSAMKDANESAGRLTDALDGSTKAGDRNSKTVSQSAQDYQSLAKEARDSGVTVTESFSKMADGAMTFGRGMALLSVSGEKNLAKMASTLATIQGGVDTFKGVKDAVIGAGEAYQALSAGSKATAAANTLLAGTNTAVATTGTAAAASMGTLSAALGPIALGLGAVAAAGYVGISMWREHEKALDANLTKTREAARTYTEAQLAFKRSIGTIKSEGLASQSKVLDEMGRHNAARYFRGKASVQVDAQIENQKGVSENANMVLDQEIKKLAGLKAKERELAEKMKENPEFRPSMALFGMTKSHREILELYRGQGERLREIKSVTDVIGQQRSNQQMAEDQIAKSIQARISLHRDELASVKTIHEAEKATLQTKQEQLKTLHQKIQEEQKSKQSEAASVGELLADPSKLAALQSQIKRATAEGASAADLVRLGKLGGSLTQDFVSTQLAAKGAEFLGKNDFLSSVRKGSDGKFGEGFGDDLRKLEESVRKMGFGGDSESAMAKVAEAIEKNAEKRQAAEQRLLEAVLRDQEQLDLILARVAEIERGGRVRNLSGS